MRVTKYLPLIGLILLIYVLQAIGIRNIIRALAGAKPIYLTAAILMIPFIILTKGLKWHLIIKGHGLNYPLMDSCITNLIGAYFGIITPGRIGEIARVFYLKERAGDFYVSLSTVVVDRVFDILTLLFFGMIGGLLLSIWLDVKITIISYPILFFLFFLAITLLFKLGYVKMVAKPLFDIFTPERYRPQMKTHFSRVHQGLKNFTQSKSAILTIAVVGMFAWTLEVTQAYFLALSLGLAIPFVFLFAISPFVTLVVLIPVSISGLGTREISFIYLLSLIGVSTDKSVAFSFLAFLASYVSYAILGSLLWIKRPLPRDKTL